MTNAQPMQCGWIDEFGNLFPKAAYKPERKHWDDAHKSLWLPVYTHPALRADCGEYGHEQGACGNASCLSNDQDEALLVAYANGRKDEAEQEAMDSKRWRMLPAFIEAHQIDYMGLLRDIDGALEAGQ